MIDVMTNQEWLLLTVDTSRFIAMCVKFIVIANLMGKNDVNYWAQMGLTGCMTQTRT